MTAISVRPQHVDGDRLVLSATASYTQLKIVLCGIVDFVAIIFMPYLVSGRTKCVVFVIAIVEILTEILQMIWWILA